jgi:hypothetical protein
LGQPSLSGTAANSGGIDGNRLNVPIAVATDGTQIAVADTANHRVLLWHAWPSSQANTMADVVLGQRDMKTSRPNGAFAAPDRLHAPHGIARARSRLLVADTGNHRVLIYPTLPTSADVLPAVVVGQTSFTESDSNGGKSTLSERGLSGPEGVASDGQNLVVADTGNNRVLIWTTVPTENFERAAVILGQPDAISKTIRNPAAGGGMSSPTGVGIKDGRLYVVDNGSHRVLIWNSIPTVSGQAPDIVLGQASIAGFSAHRGGTAPTAGSLYSPYSLCFDDSHLYVGDYSNSRLLIWNTLTPETGQPADDVAGVNVFTSSSGSILGGVSACSQSNGLFFASDSSGSRVHYYRGTPGRAYSVPDGVIGQPDQKSLGHNNGGISSSRLYEPHGVLATEGGLYVADTDNGRVLGLPLPR